MRLADFLSKNMEPILARWDSFAATRLPAAADMTALELRDHGQQLLEAIIVDLGTEQSPQQRAARSQGLGPTPFPARETAAQVHAALRARSGFDVLQLASEYRALRASVLSLWRDAVAPVPPHIEDMVRFNEAIDQALAESIAQFSSQVEQSRNLLLGMLGHDIRNPLQTIQVTAACLSRMNAGEAVSEAAKRLSACGARIQALVEDLTDFNRANLGLGIPVVAMEVDLGQSCDCEVDLLRAAHPDRRIDLAVEGDCRGRWDGGRLQQLLANLIVNALQHGAADAPVRVHLEGRTADVRIEVHNAGARIPQQSLNRIFEPLNRGPYTDRQHGLGLGLYIVREIARAHGGKVEACSSDDDTVFTAWLPKMPPRGHVATARM